MTRVTVRLPDDTAQRLKQLATSRGISLNKLLEEFSTIAITAHEAEIRFGARTAGADRGRALAVLDRLDATDQVGA